MSPLIKRRLLFVLSVSALSFAACRKEPTEAKAPQGEGAPPPSAPPAATDTAAGGGGGAVTPEARKEAEEIFSTRCTTCHGQTGAGDGAASAGLTPKPRNFREPAWQQSVTDEHIEKIIVYGGAAVGKSPMMPGNPDLQSKPDVVAALREHVRNLKQ